MINDINSVMLEGTVVGDVFISEKDDKKAMNFMLRCDRFIDGRMESWMHPIVAWNYVAEKHLDDVKDGVYVRIRGHLQNGSFEKEDGKRITYSKVCADKIEVEE